MILLNQCHNDEVLIRKKFHFLWVHVIMNANRVQFKASDTRSVPY